MKKLTLWQCDDGTYDICEDGEVIRMNVRRDDLLRLPEYIPGREPNVAQRDELREARQLLSRLVAVALATKRIPKSIRHPSRFTVEQARALLGRVRP